MASVSVMPATMPTAAPPLDTAMRALARRRGIAGVTSIYLDVDDRYRPTLDECRGAFEQLAVVVVRQVAATGDDHRVPAVEADVARMRSWLSQLTDRSATRGVALFASGAPAFLETLELPVPVHDQAVFGPATHLVQMVDVVEEHERFLAVGVDATRLRLLRVELGMATELPGLSSFGPYPVDLWIEPGGGSSHDDATGHHLRDAATAVAQALADHPCDRLVLTGSERAMAGLEAQLDPAIRGKVIGRADVHPSAAPKVIADAVLAVAESARRCHEVEVVEELRRRAPDGHGGVAGLAATLVALARGNVRALVVSEGFTAPGTLCWFCGWRGATVQLCPACGRTSSDLADVTDIVGLAVAEALAQDATVEICRAADLDRLGRIGALLRR